MALNITIKQGKTFSMVFRYGSEPVVFKAITGITKAAPAVLTVTGHGLTDGWAVAVVGVFGMEEINAVGDPPRPSDYKPATVIDANSIKLMDVNSAQFTAYDSGGYIRYYTPVDLTGYIARMKIKSRAGGTEYVSLVSPTNITIDNTAKTITVTITAVATAALTFSYGEYELEVESPGGVVKQLVSGSVTLEKEIVA